MSPQPLEGAIADALADQTNSPGMCLQQTRTWYEIPAKYGDATDAWYATKHFKMGDRNPPRGAPVWWVGGSGGHGHIGMSLGDGTVRSTDADGSGKVGTKPLGWFESAWGLTYKGWSADVNDVDIPELMEYFIETPPDPVDPDPPEPEDPDLVVGFGRWAWYSGKKTNDLTVRPDGDWHPLDIGTQPASGITQPSSEFHFLYLRVELPKGRSANRVLETKFVRSDGDATAYDSEEYGLTRDSHPYYNVHLEDGSGLGGQWWVKVSGGKDPIKLTTRYAKTHLFYEDAGLPPSRSRSRSTVRALLRRLIAWIVQ